MVSINRKPEFGEENILIEDFILLDYNTNKDSLYLNFVGTDEGRKKVIVYKYKDRFKYEKTSFTYENDLPIHNIISCDFFSRKSVDYLLVCKNENEDKYFNKLIYEENGKVMSKDIGESRALPMLICYKTSRPSLLIQTENKTQIWTFPKLNLSQDPEIVEVDLPMLHPQHTSAYLPLDNSYSPVLVLDSFKSEKKERALQIFKFDGKAGKFIKKGVLDLPDKIGNLVFADLNNDTVADLAFISEENSKYYLNIFLNTENFGSGTKKIEREISRKCVLEENKMPTGLYPVDLYSNSKIQLALMIKEEKYKYVLIENDTWSIKEEVFDFNYEQLYSISFADLSEIGREGLVLNYKRNNKPVLSFRKNGLLQKDCYSVSVLSYDGYAPEKSFCSSSVGMTYRYNFLEKTKKGVGFQRPQTSYLTLKPPVLFLGIGTSPFLISFEGIGGPFINESRPFNIDIEIIPNSKLVMSPRDGKYCKLVLVLSTKQNLFYVFLIYFIVFIITVITIFYLHIKEVKKRKKARKEEAIFFNFDAL